jgi:hypothetical protein
VTFPRPWSLYRFLPRDQSSHFSRQFLAPSNRLPILFTFMVASRARGGAASLSRRDLMVPALCRSVAFDGVHRHAIGMRRCHWYRNQSIDAIIATSIHRTSKKAPSLARVAFGSRFDDAKMTEGRVLTCAATSRRGHTKTFLILFIQIVGIAVRSILGARTCSDSVDSRSHRNKRTSGPLRAGVGTDRAAPSNRGVGT